MATLFFRLPRLTLLAIFLTLAAGLAALGVMGRQEDPSLTERFGVVVASFPGADAERMEALIVEDDYEFELSFLGAPSPALTSMDRDGRVIYVGKAKGNHSLSQDEINALLAEHAEAGSRVVRLKGGDPFIFGRGGEELAYLKERGIAVETVPGVTAALGAASAAGLPLTHRDHANRLTILTGHDRNGVSEFDSHVLADTKGTVVIYMGLGAVPRIMETALASGRAPETPVAVIEKATLPEQRILKTTLADLAGMVAERQVSAPALIVLGDVAALAEGEIFEAVVPEGRRLAV